MKPWLKNRNDKSACVNIFSELSGIFRQIPAQHYKLLIIY